MAKQERKPFKDWFDREAAVALGKQIGRESADFDQPRFVRHCVKKLGTLEFNGRVKQFAAAMATTLPDHYPDAISIVEKSLPPVLPDCESVTDGWLQWPVGQFIADYGQDHFKESMDAMSEVTRRFSSEYAVRPFVEHQSDATFDYFYKLLDDPSPHVRRWCSEGCRTRLPWGSKLHDLIADPSPIWPILDALKGDDELYVRRSVANNMNDLSKDHPKAVLAKCKTWSKAKDPNIDWVIKHSLRGLIKAGDSKALAAIGFKKPDNLAVTLQVKPGKIHIGESVTVTATIENRSSRRQELLLDYVVHYKGKNGGERPKVFKWKTLSVAGKQTVVHEKKHPMRLTTIRALYPGDHRVELQINGEIVANKVFRLLAG